jgi:hypothetical protein
MEDAAADFATMARQLAEKERQKAKLFPFGS